MEINYLSHFFFSFMATAAFGVLFQTTPKRTLVLCGLVGAVGWCIYIFLGKDLGYGSFYANLIAAASLTVLAELFARLLRQPATIFIATGVIPLVPGLGMYKGMNKIIENSYDQGINILITAGTDSVAIALGVMVISSIFRVLRNRQLEKKL